MINRIEVSGFKSLSNFKLDIEPGINILVGPNGSGKTNIVLFFEFLSYIVGDNLSEAFSALGGAGAVLEKKSESEYKNKLTVKIFGGSNTIHSSLITYEYSFVIGLSKKTNTIYYRKQKLILNRHKNNINSAGEEVLNIDIETNTKLEPIVTIKSMDKKNIRGLYLPRGHNSKKFLKKLIEENCVISNSLMNTLSRFFLEIRFDIQNDLTGGEVFNIIPSNVKKPEDLASTPRIKKDGSGLAATLYSLKNIKQKDLLLRSYGYKHILKRNMLDNPNIIFNNIVENIKLANPSIVDVEVLNDPFNNKLNVKIHIKSNKNVIVLPLSAMSDGTIKWISLITAIMTSTSIFSIEEPENYLHPWMQSHVLNIMRDSLTKSNIKEDKKFILMTTHSESLLNSAKPEEIILVYMKDGKTKAKKIKNIDLLKNEISNTGFGIGHFYFSNSLDNE